MATSSSQSFGNLLRRYRLAARLTQEQLAELAGMSVRGLSDLERGARRLPRSETIHLLSEALNLSLDDRAILEIAARQHRVSSAQVSGGSLAISPYRLSLGVPRSWLYWIICWKMASRPCW